jgi:hypothetical protein
VLDRSGASRHGDEDDAETLSGAFGEARAISPAGDIVVARDPGLAPGASGITVEAYVWLDVGGQVATIAGDRATADPTVTFEVELRNENQLSFTVHDSGSYDRALDGFEVARNFAAGPDP